MFSTYEERLSQTPQTGSNRWLGERGESLCLPSSEEAKAALQKKGLKGIEYKNAIPDFSPVAESTVDIAYMSKERSSRNVVDGKDGKNVRYLHQAGEGSNASTGRSMSRLMMKYNDPGNFQQADILTAEQWSKEKREGKTWTEADVSKYRQDNGLTWHECNDGNTMQLVPKSINSDFGHLGGVAETKRKQQYISEAAMQNPVLQVSEEEVGHMDKMPDQQLKEYMKTKHAIQDGSKSMSDNDNTNNRSEGGEKSMDKKKEWENQLQQWREETRKYQEAQRQKQGQQQQAKKANNNTDNADMDNMQRQRVQKKKDHEISR